MCVGCKTMLSKFEDFDFSLEGGKLIVFPALPWAKMELVTTY